MVAKLMYDYSWVDQIEDPLIKKIILENGYIAITDPEGVATFCDEAIELNPKIVEIYKKGKKQVIGKLIGHVMQRTNSGVEPPELITQMLEEKLK
jgi:aspartyl-tRNA(Asn)/glutamyl-tRNA(Gln) amidotransferase subunit B